MSEKVIEEDAYGNALYDPDLYVSAGIAEQVDGFENVRKIIENHPIFNHFGPNNFSVRRKMLSKFQEKMVCHKKHYIFGCTNTYY